MSSVSPASPGFPPGVRDGQLHLHRAPSPHSHSHSHSHMHQQQQHPRGHIPPPLLSPSSVDTSMDQPEPLSPGADKVCGGCKDLIDNDAAGTVVSFGAKYFHIDCFRCSKCQERVTADTNLLLLSDGTPVCSTCSYQCVVCGLPIMDEAIMTGDESYHAACFTCKHCHKRIEELVFAKTSQGMYCMACHNERAARNRRHAEARRRQGKKDKEKDKEKSRLREQPSQQSLSASASSSSHLSAAGGPISPSGGASPHSASLSSAGSYFSEPPSGISVGDSRSPWNQDSPSLNPRSAAISHDRDRDEMRRNLTTMGLAATSPRPGGGNAPADPNISGEVDSLGPPVSPMPTGAGSNATPNMGRRGSADDGKPQMRHHALAGMHSPSSSLGSAVGLGLGLGVPGGGPTSKAERRRSMNPGAYSADQVAAVNGSMPSSTSLTEGVADAGRGGALGNSDGAGDGRTTPLPPSPLRSGFGQQQQPSSPLRSSTPGRPASPSPPVAPLNIIPKRTVSRDPAEKLSTSPSSISTFGPQRNSSLPESDHYPSLAITGPPRTPSPSHHVHAQRAAGERTPSGSSRLRQRSPATDDFPQEDLDLPRSPLSDAQVFSSAPVTGSTAPFAVTVGFENDTPRASMSSERGTSSTATVTTPPGLETEGQPPRQRSTSAVSTEPPQLDAPRPLSFNLADDPDFAMLFQNQEASQRQLDSSIRPLPTLPKRAPGPAGGGKDIEVDSTTPKLATGSDAENPSAEASSSSSNGDKSDPLVEFPHSAPSPTYASGGRPSPPLVVPGQTNTTPTLPRSASWESAYNSTSALRARQDSELSISGVVGGEANEALKLLRTLVDKAREAGEAEVKVGVVSLDLALREVESIKDKYAHLKGKYDGIKRASARYIEGLTVASEDYEKEVSARREVEAEVKRLRAQIHGQTARLSLMDADVKRQDLMQRRSRELARDMQGLEKDISKLRAERDLSLAEVEELSASSKSGALLAAASATVSSQPSSLSRSLSVRLDTVKEQYREKLEPLTEEYERLRREVNDLRTTRETYIDESTTLQARNEELSGLAISLSRQVEEAQDALERARRGAIGSPGGIFVGSQTMKPGAFRPTHHQYSNSASLSSMLTSTTLQEEPAEVAKYVKVTTKPIETMEPAPAIRKFKWYKSSKGPEQATPVQSATASSTAKQQAALAPPLGHSKGRVSVDESAGGARSGREHVFQPHGISPLRYTRCDHCGDKMWGPITELRCALCGTNCHTKCGSHLDKPCSGPSGSLQNPDDAAEAGPAPVSMFGRDLTEQADADGETVPVIVRKCIAAVDAVGMEYEGIYRKTGGSSQSKHITQLFERGDYDSFDLSDQDTFNDISSVTSVLKTYFRSLPDPLLTYKLHEKFVEAATLRDPDQKRNELLPLIRQLPRAHYDTLRYLMMHLHRVMGLQKENLMSARNLGVVFGPTLMRSVDRAREFADMAGKAQTIDWLVENAELAFSSSNQREG